MSVQTIMSAKGQVVIPKGVRDNHDWSFGTPLEVIDRPDGVLLRRPASNERTMTVEEFWASVPPHDGPPVSLEEMNEGVMRAARESWPPRSG